MNLRSDKISQFKMKNPEILRRDNMKHRIVKKLMAGVLAGALSLTLLLTPGVQVFAEEQTENLTEEDILSGEGRIPDESIGSEEKIADPVEQDETLPETAEDEIDTGKAEEENKDQEEPVVQDGWVLYRGGMVFI